MLQKVYVGNLPLNVTESDVKKIFSRYGTVHSVNLMTDRETGLPRGYGFVEMEREEARLAASALNGKLYGKRNLFVGAAKQRLLGAYRREAKSKW